MAETLTLRVYDKCEAVLYKMETPTELFFFIPFLLILTIFKVTMVTSNLYGCYDRVIFRYHGTLKPAPPQKKKKNPRHALKHSLDLKVTLKR